MRRGAWLFRILDINTTYYIVLRLAGDASSDVPDGTTHVPDGTTHVPDGTTHVCVTQMGRPMCRKTARNGDNDVVREVPSGRWGMRDVNVPSDTWVVPSVRWVKRHRAITGRPSS